MILPVESLIKKKYRTDKNGVPAYPAKARTGNSGGPTPKRPYKKGGGEGMPYKIRSPWSHKKGRAWNKRGI